MLTASRPGLVESAQQAFRVKPLGRVRLNRHHWLAPYLLFFAPLTDPSDKIRDLVTGDEVALGAGISWYNHPEFGWMLEYDGSTTVGTEMDFGRSFTCGTHGGLFLHWDMDDTSSWSGTASFLQLSATSEVGVFISHASNFYRFGYGKSAGNFANAARFAHFHRANNFSQCRGFVNGYFALESTGGSSTGDTTGSLRLFPTPSTRLCRLSYIGIYDTPTLAAASHWDSEEGRLYNTLYDLVVPEGRKFYSYSQGGAAPATAAVALTGNSATLAASASFSPGTKTATATLTGTSVTLAVAATHEPEHFATASLTAGSGALAVVATHEPEHFATADLVGANAELVASASFSPGTKTATVDLIAQSAALGADITFAPGTKTALVDLVAQTATLAASASFAPGTKTATADLVAQTASLTTTATHEPEFETTVALAGGSGVLVASAAFSAGGIRQAVVALDAASASLAASASFAAGTKTASAALTGQTASLIATAAFTPPPTAVVTLVSGSASLSASTSFAPGTKTATAILIGSGASLSSLVEVPYEATVILAAQTAILATTATHEPPTFAADAALVGSTATIQGVFIFAEAGFFVNAVVELFASSATLTAFAGKRFPPHSVKKFEAVMRYTTFEGIKRTTSALAV